MFTSNTKPECGLVVRLGKSRPIDLKAQVATKRCTQIITAGSREVDHQLVLPAMTIFSHLNLFRNALRSSVVVGSSRGVTSKAYPDHIPLNTFEHAFLTVGTGLAALLDPRRGGGWVRRVTALVSNTHVRR